MATAFSMPLDSQSCMKLYTSQQWSELESFVPALSKTCVGETMKLRAAVLAFYNAGAFAQWCGITCREMNTEHSPQKARRNRLHFWNKCLFLVTLSKDTRQTSHTIRKTKVAASGKKCWVCHPDEWWRFSHFGQISNAKKKKKTYSKTQSGSG